MKKKIRILEMTLGNYPGEEVEIEEETEGEVYYIDGFERWCYFEKSEEGKYFEYVNEEIVDIGI